MTHLLSTPFSVGRYLLSPHSIHCSTAGGYLASVSIRSGKGSATHDRIHRFAAVFDSRASALRYAVQQGQTLLAALVSTGSTCLSQPAAHFN